MILLFLANNRIQWLHLDFKVKGIISQMFLLMATPAQMLPKCKWLGKKRALIRIALDKLVVTQLVSGVTLVHVKSHHSSVSHPLNQTLSSPIDSDFLQRPSPLFLLPPIICCPNSFLLPLPLKREGEIQNSKEVFSFVVKICRLPTFYKNKLHIFQLALFENSLKNKPLSLKKKKLCSHFKKQKHKVGVNKKKGENIISHV